MMQATDLWDGDGSSDSGRLDWARVRTILVERKMRAGALLIVDVRGEDSAQMALIEDHNVIETFAPERTDHPLDVRVLPG